MVEVGFQNETDLAVKMSMIVRFVPRQSDVHAHTDLPQDQHWRMKPTKILVLIIVSLLAGVAGEAEEHATAVQAPGAAILDYTPAVASPASTDGPRSSLRHRRKATAKIIGGVDADLADYSYFVQGVGCGGTLIAEDVALTAAHCSTSKWDAWGRSAVVGSKTRKNLTIGSERILIRETEIHPLFTSKDYHYDFQIVALKRRVRMNQTIVKLNRNNAYPTAGSLLTVAGFGVKSENGVTMSSTLQTARVVSVSDSVCQSVYRDDADYEVDSICQFCAGMTGNGPCYGDIGTCC